MEQGCLSLDVGKKDQRREKKTRCLSPQGGREPETRMAEYRQVGKKEMLFDGENLK